MMLTEEDHLELQQRAVDLGAQLLVDLLAQVDAVDLGSLAAESDP